MISKGNAELTRLHILQAATDIIAEKGLAALTAGSLISRAGISKGGLYHHFRQMDEVVLAALDQLVDEYLAGLQTVSAQRPEVLFAQLETDLRELYLQRSQRIKALHGFLGAVMHVPAFRGPVTKVLRGLKERHRQQFKAAFPLAHTDTLNAATEMLETFILGSILQSYLEPDGDYMAQWPEFSKHLWWRLSEASGSVQVSAVS
ncbi:TetR/AcrR family transcriptional regulator [Marinobacterium jannaschii]|uniref:TetR/AcrR family transcriptional regulator n=1 Tax=Marinobacterium jannaschii TaxID=64970 RepID=UPI000683EDCB|nr:TetR/AcrR family transcriptional regulator [Marinobacterium jannaschii]